MNKGELILSVAAMSTECSRAAIQRMIPSESYRYDVIEKLKIEKSIRVYTGHGLKGYLLTAACRRRMLAEQPERYRPYLDKADNPYPTEPARRERCHRISETLAMMLCNDVEIYPDQKAAAFRPQSEHPCIQDRPSFYPAGELQQMGDIAIKIKGSRMTGVLLAAERYYLVYNTGSALMRWALASEKRAAILLYHRFGMGLGWDRYKERPADAIMLGQDMSIAGQLLAGAESNKHFHFVLDDTFCRFHYIPNTPEGDSLLRLLLRPELCRMLNTELARNCEAEKIFGSNFEYDGVYDDKPVLFCWDFDMLRIRNFRHGLEWLGLVGIAFAFDFQKPVLERYFGDLVTVRAISLVNAKRWLFQGGK